MEESEHKLSIFTHVISCCSMAGVFFALIVVGSYDIGGYLTSEEGKPYWLVRACT